MAAVGAEVYVNDERKGNIGSSGRLVLSSIFPGRHILRVSKAGEKDDVREIEIRDGATEQVIQANLKPIHTPSHPSPSHGSHGSGGTDSIHSSILPGIVACTNPNCGARFAEGAKFCGRCGNSSFVAISNSATNVNNKPISVNNNHLGQGFNCPRCSTILPANTKFCGRCGLNIGQTQNLHSSQPPSQPPSFKPLYNPNVPRAVERVCRRCNLIFAPHIKFCGRCGSTLNA